MPSYSLQMDQLRERIADIGDFLDTDDGAAYDKGIRKGIGALESEIEDAEEAEEELREAEDDDDDEDEGPDPTSAD
jgi:hypothetical protein